MGYRGKTGLFTETKMPVSTGNLSQTGALKNFDKS
jgi:hypothetical protein